MIARLVCEGQPAVVLIFLVGMFQCIQRKPRSRADATGIGGRLQMRRFTDLVNPYPIYIDGEAEGHWRRFGWLEEGQAKPRCYCLGSPRHATALPRSVCSALQYLIDFSKIHISTWTENQSFFAFFAPTVVSNSDRDCFPDFSPNIHYKRDTKLSKHASKPNPPSLPPIPGQTPVCRSVLLRLALATGGGRLLGLVGKQLGVDVGKDATLGDRDIAEQLVQFLVVADSQLQVTGNDARFLVVAGGVACQFEDLGGQVLEDCGQVDWGASTDTLRVVAFTKMAVKTTNWKLETSLGRA